MSYVNGLSLGSCPRCHAVINKATFERGFRETPPPDPWKTFEPDPLADVTTLSCGCTFNGDAARDVAETVRAAVRVSAERA